MGYCDSFRGGAFCIGTHEHEGWRLSMSDFTRRSRLQNTVGLVAEYLVTGLIMLMTLVSTLRMLGILS
jgi:hypothetical protein